MKAVRHPYAKRVVASAATLAAVLALVVVSPTQADALSLQGCVDTPATVGTARVDRTCASFGNSILSVWFEGENLNQELAVVGSVDVSYGGVTISIEGEWGTRMVDATTWEAYFQINSPIVLGPWTTPIDVADDGTRITLWWDLSEYELSGATNADRNGPELSSSVTFELRDAKGNTAPLAPVSLGLSLAPAPEPPPLPIQPADPIMASPPASAPPPAALPPPVADPAPHIGGGVDAPAASAQDLRAGSTAPEPAASSVIDHVSAGNGNDPTPEARADGLPGRVIRF